MNVHVKIFTAAAIIGLGAYAENVMANVPTYDRNAYDNALSYGDFLDFYYNYMDKCQHWYNSELRNDEDSGNAENERYLYDSEVENFVDDVNQVSRACRHWMQSGRWYFPTDVFPEMVYDTRGDAGDMPKGDARFIQVRRYWMVEGPRYDNTNARGNRFYRDGPNHFTWCRQDLSEQEVEDDEGKISWEITNPHNVGCWMISIMTNAERYAQEYRNRMTNFGGCQQPNGCWPVATGLRQRHKRETS